jgi:hypothetical protein
VFLSRKEEGNRESLSANTRTFGYECLIWEAFEEEEGDESNKRIEKRAGNAL